MADSKVSQFTAATVIVDEDFLHMIDDPNGTPTDKKLTIGQLFGAIPSNTAITGTFSVIGDKGINVGTANTITSASATGTVGQLAWDATYFYVCVATDTWKRVGISTW